MNTVVQELQAAQKANQQLLKRLQDEEFEKIQMKLQIQTLSDQLELVNNTLSHTKYYWLT